MNWYKRSEIDVTNAYANFVNVIKSQATQYGLIFNNGDIISASSNKIRLFISDPEEQYRYVINLRVHDKGADMIVFSLNSEGNLFTKKYSHHDVYRIVDDALDMIVNNINSVRGSQIK